MSRFAYSTLEPSIDSIETRLSMLRVTRAVLPSGVKTTWQGADIGAPKSIFPAALTVLPLIVKTETVPSERFATRARVPAGLMDTPLAPAPALSVAITMGGECFRSMTVTLSSGMVFVGSARSIFMAAVTNAIDPFGAMAALWGGPTTDAGAWTSPMTFAGETPRSIIVTVSGAG